VAIERFDWTSHALLRLNQRQLTRFEVERAIRDEHDARLVNEGQADWLVEGITEAGVRFGAIYDHPVDRNETIVRVVSAWRLL
jgi:hypothetical protein